MTDLAMASSPFSFSLTVIPRCSPGTFRIPTIRIESAVGPSNSVPAIETESPLPIPTSLSFTCNTVHENKIKLDHSYRSWGGKVSAPPTLHPFHPLILLYVVAMDQIIQITKYLIAEAYPDTIFSQLIQHMQFIQSKLPNITFSSDNKYADTPMYVTQNHSLS